MSARRVLVNATSLFAGRVVGAAVTVVVAVSAANVLDVEGFGLVVSTLAAGFLANMLVTFGTDTVITRAVAARRSDALAVTQASLQLQFSIALVLVGASLVGWLVGAPVVVLIQALALLPLAVVTVAGSVLRGLERMDRLLIGSGAGGIATLVALAGGFAIERAAWVPIAALAVGAVTNAGVLGAFAVRLGGMTGSRASPDGSREVLRLVLETTPFAAMVVLAALGAQVGLLLVEFAGDETTGGYGVAVRLTEAARLVPAAAMGAFFPAMMSGLHQTTRYRRWLRLLGLYAVAATAALLLFAGPINRLLFDDQPQGAVLTRILALGLVVTVARLALSFSMIAAGRERAVLVSAFVGALITIVGGLATVRRFGAPGVAWSQLAGLVGATAVLALQRSLNPSSAAEPTPSPVGVGKLDTGHGQLE